MADQRKQEVPPSMLQRTREGPQEKNYGFLSFTTALENLAILLLGIAIAVAFFTRCAISNIKIPQLVLVAAPSHENCTWTLEKLRENVCEKPEHPNTEQPICKLCPNAWRLARGNCYFFSEGPETWNASREYCWSQGSHLFTIQHDSEMDLLDTMEVDTDFFWTGYQYNLTEKMWFLPDEFPVQGYKMKLHSSSSSSSKNSCGAYQKRDIYPASCTSLNRWICKKKAFQLNL